MATPLPENAAEFSVHELVLATRGRIQRPGAEGVVGIATDTRHGLRGKAFVALVGERFDGHAFVETAVERGARLLIVADGRITPERAAALPEGVAILAVPDTTRALCDVARLHRTRWGGSVICVVGSAGKTTTRSVLSALFCAAFPGSVHSTKGNLNNQVGVPLTLLGLRPEHRYCVLEIGTNSPGEVARLSEISRPDVAILTLIDLEHTEGLGDLDGVEREESAALASLPEAGIAIGYGDDPRVARSVRGSPAARRFLYGSAPDCALCIRSRSTDRVDGSDLVLVACSELGGREYRIRSPLVGLPGALAVGAGLLALLACAPLALGEGALEAALAGVGEPGRATIHPLPSGVIVVDDSYNSNPASVRHAIRTGEELAQASGGRLWLVLGDMLELGALSAREHRAIGREAAGSLAHAVWTIGEETRELAAEVAAERKIGRHFADPAGVGPALAPEIAPRDVILVKASRGVRAEGVVRYLLGSRWGTGTVPP